MIDVLKQLFAQHFGSAALLVQPLQNGLGASGRMIVRLENDRVSAIGIGHEVREENTAFVEFSRHFRRYGLPVPEIYAEDFDQGAYLEEDLGDTTLFQFLSEHRAGEQIAPEVVEAYRKVVEVLPRFQVEAGRDLNYKLCYPRGSFDRQSITWDLNYFKSYFLRLAGVPFHEQALETDFNRLTRFLLSADRDYFLYRDFQSRNIMLRDGHPYFLDYQGGRRGALQYDIASLLFDGKADLPAELRQGLLDHYLDTLGKFIALDHAKFLHHYYAYVYVRMLQALGAYGFRGYYERKAHFLQSIPYALKNLRWLLRNVTLPVKLPSLMAALTAMSGEDQPLSRFSEVEAETAPVTGAAVNAATEAAPMTGARTAATELTVLVSSFSFHRGPLADESGNGGGFVFDARSLPNPGREERFKRLTGKDQPVIEYLNQQAGVPRYLDSAMSLVEASIVEYQRRGFLHLMVSFGCTGGQHRSVFLAEQAAKRLAGRSGVKVVLRHREQESWVR